MALSAAELFGAVIKEKKNARIKLLGDSITHGNGGTGFKQSGEVIIGGYRRSPDSFCWANLFSELMKEKYGATVVNNACIGTNIQFVINNFDTLVDEEDDLIICTIGTNNRHQYFKDAPRVDRDEYLAAFYENIKVLAGKLRECGKRVIIMANIPTLPWRELDGEDFWRIFHMCDVNDAYKRAAAECDFTFVSLYDLFEDYLKTSGVNPEGLYADGLHPNDDGYRVMLDLILGALGA